LQINVQGKPFGKNTGNNFGRGIRNTGQFGPIREENNEDVVGPANNMNRMHMSDAMPYAIQQARKNQIAPVRDLISKNYEESKRYEGSPEPLVNQNEYGL